MLTLMVNGWLQAEYIFSHSIDPFSLFFTDLYELQIFHDVCEVM